MKKRRILQETASYNVKGTLTNKGNMQLEATKETTRSTHDADAIPSHIFAKKPLIKPNWMSQRDSSERKSMAETGYIETYGPGFATARWRGPGWCKSRRRTATSWRLLRKPLQWQSFQLASEAWPWLQRCLKTCTELCLTCCLGKTRARANFPCPRRWWSQCNDNHKMPWFLFPVTVSESQWAPSWERSSVKPFPSLASIF